MYRHGCAGAWGLPKLSSLTPSTSDAASVTPHMQQRDIQRHCKHADSMQQNSTGQQQQQQAAGRRQQGGALPSVPEHAVLGNVTSGGSVQAMEPRKVLKKKRKKVKRRSRPTQLGGMTDVEKSRWMLEHCKVGCNTAWRSHVLALAAVAKVCWQLHVPLALSRCW